MNQPARTMQPVLMWMAHDGWQREFATSDQRGSDPRRGRSTTPFAERTLSLEPPAYFKTEDSRQPT